MTEQANRREFFRAHDNLFLEYRVLSDEEETDLFHKKSAAAIQNEPDANLCEIEQIISVHIDRIRQNLPDVAACLSALDRKLDYIRQLKFPMPMDSVYVSNKHHVNISAGGIAFMVEKPVNQGDMMEIRITLPSNQASLLLYGTVIHAEPERQNTNLIRVGIKFQHLGENEQDMLVQYSLARERELLRKKSAAVHEGTNNSPDKEGAG